MTPRAVRWRAHVQPDALPGPAKPWHPRRDERVAVLHVACNQHQRWRYALLREMVGGVVVAEYATAATPYGEKSLRRYARQHRADTGPGFSGRLHVLTPEQFGHRLWNLAYRDRWLLVGAELPWQLSRIAMATAPARRPVKQGRRHELVLTLPGCAALSKKEDRLRQSFYRDRIFIDPRGPGKLGAFVSFGTPRDPRSQRRQGPFLYRGRFADVVVMGGALAGHDLSCPAEAARLVGISWPPPTGAPIERLRGEAAAVTATYVAQRELLGNLGVAPHKAFSTGSLVRAALDATGAVPPAAKLVEISPDRLALAAASLLGGDTSARLVHQLLPCLLVDRSGDFARCFSATGWQRAWTCDAIPVEDVDPAWVEGQVATLEPDLAALGQVFCLVRMRGEHMPARVEVRKGQFVVHLGPVTFDGPWPCHALDLCTSWASCGLVPEVVSAFRFVFVGEQPGLAPLMLPTGRQVDLYREDVGLAVLKERARVRADSSLPDHERKRVTGLLKLFGNGLTFGLPARVDRHDLAEPVSVRVANFDGTWRETCTDRPEVPARWTFLPMAAAVAACSRFLSARFQARVGALGGSWLCTAVDSVAVVAAPDEAKVDVVGGAVNVLSYSQVSRLLGEDDIYLGCPPGLPLWKAEGDGLDNPVLGYCAGPNKLVLGRWEGQRFKVTRSCDTALGGHLVDPSGRGDPLLEDGHHRWPSELLGAMVEAGASFDEEKGWPRPRVRVWPGRWAVRRLQVTSGTQLRRLRRIFAGCDVRAWDHYLRAESVEPFDHRAIYALEAEAAPRMWPSLDWRFADGRPAPPGSFPAKTVEVHLLNWRRTALSSLAQAVATPRWAVARGLLTPAPVVSEQGLVELCGRDAAFLDLLDADPDAHMSDEVAVYGPAFPPACAWPGCGRPVSGGRGRPRLWCPQHARRSGSERRRARGGATEQGPVPGRRAAHLTGPNRPS